jgi:cysteinyl-tRNA synthetase
MAMKYLGETFDIHGGGQDLIFPHHENEIAQSEAYCGKPFANYWCENGLVNLGGAKMSKSVGNFFFIEDIAKDWDPEVVRYYLMSTHYRSPIEFSTERLAEASKAYARLRGPLERAAVWTSTEGPAPGGALGEAVAQAEARFTAEMEDDFNTAGALGHLFDLVTAINRAFDEGGASEAVQGARALHRLGGILGLFWRAPGGESWSPEVLALAEARVAARKAKDWKQSDELRDRLAALGVIVEDSAQGQKLKSSR